MYFNDLCEHYEATYLLPMKTDAVAFSNAHFGVGTGTIYLDNVGCTGSETNLINCPRSSTVYCRYGHSEDAGVRCQGLKKMSQRCNICNKLN